MRLNVDTRNLLRTFAALKGVPVAKVVTNAAKDFTKAARRATPITDARKSDYSRLFWGGQVHYVKYSKFMLSQPARRYRKKRGSPYRGWSYQKRRMDKARVRIPRGWSQKSWIGIFRALGMASMPAVGNLPKKVADISHVDRTRLDSDKPAITLVDEIHFDSTEQMTAAEKIAAAGFNAAAKILVKEFTRMVNSIHRGQQ